MPNRTHYQVLGVQPDAEDLVIKAAYRAREIRRKYKKCCAVLLSLAMPIADVLAQNGRYVVDEDNWSPASPASVLLTIIIIAIILRHIYKKENKDEEYSRRLKELEDSVLGPSDGNGNRVNGSEKAQNIDRSANGKIQCPRCKSSNSYSSSTCRKCYFDLRLVNDVTSKTRCRRCDSAVQNDSENCWSCGGRLKTKFTITPADE